jgi:hypothetical protein
LLPITDESVGLIIILITSCLTSTYITFLLSSKWISLKGMVEHKSCNRIYEYPDPKFSARMKVTTVTENRQAEKRGSTGIHQPHKTETSLPTRKEDDICPFKINIRASTRRITTCYNYQKMYYYTLLVGMCGVLLSLPELNKLTKKLLLANCTKWNIVFMIPRLYISNVIVKAQHIWLSDRGTKTKDTSAQVMIDYLTVSTDTSCIINAIYCNSAFADPISANLVEHSPAFK